MSFFLSLVIRSPCYLQIVTLVIASKAKQSRKSGSPRRLLRLAMTIKRSLFEKDEPLAKASEIMQERKIRHIAITEKGKIVGILSIKDLEKCWTGLK